ncbi:MAG: hypothetical protein ACOCP4_06030 [Candidatus Woesearchaeota archaeon]
MNELDFLDLINILKGEKATNKVKEVAKKTKWDLVEQGLSEKQAGWVATGFIGGYELATQFVENFVNENMKIEANIQEIDKNKLKKITEKAQKMVKETFKDDEK